MPTNRPSSVPETAPPANGVLTKPVGSLPGSGGGMDRKLEKRRFPPKRIALIVGIVALVALVVFALLSQGGGQRLQVERDRLTISTVAEGDFQEYVAVTGTVLPERTVYLDAVVGGQVGEKLAEEGAMVTAGQPLLVLSNDNLTLQMMTSESQLQEQISTMRAQRLALDQNQLNLQQQLTNR